MGVAECPDNRIDEFVATKKKKKKNKTRLPRIMQGPGYTRAYRVLNSHSRVKSRTKKYVHFPVLSEPTHMSDADVMMIINKNKMDEAEEEANRLKNGDTDRPETAPPDFDRGSMNMNMSGSMISSLNE